MGLYLTYSRTASLRSQTDNEKDKNVTDAFARSVELLDSKGGAARQGGIYALEKIAEDNPERRSTIIKIMTSYIRGETYQKFHERLKEENLTDEKLIEKLVEEPMPSDIEAAIEVFKRQQISSNELLKDSNILDFEFDLSNAYIFNVDLGNTKFNRINFSDSKMIQCSFDETKLSKSLFAASDLRGSSFVDSTLKDCEFKGTNFQECNFQGCNLSGSTFENCDLTNVKNLTKEQIDSTKLFDEYTRLTLPKEIKESLKNEGKPGR